MKGLRTLAKQELKGKKLLYFADFENNPNRDLIKTMTNSQRDIIYNDNNKKIILPKITTTTKETLSNIKDKDLLKNSIIIELPYSYKNTIIRARRNMRKASSKGRNFILEESLEKKRENVLYFIESLNDKPQVSFEIPNIKFLKNQYNYHVSYADLINNKFEQLIKNIAFFNQDIRKSCIINCEDNHSKIKIIIIHHIDIWYALEIGRSVFFEIKENLNGELLNFLRFLIEFIENPHFCSTYKQDGKIIDKRNEKIIDDNGFFYENQIKKAYLSVNGNEKSEETLRGYLSKLSCNTDKNLRFKQYSYDLSIR